MTQAKKTRPSRKSSPQKVRIGIVKIGLVGAEGRMGKTIQKLIRRRSDLKLVWKAPGPEHRGAFTLDSDKINSGLTSRSLSSRKEKAKLVPDVMPDVIIDFSQPEASLKAAALAAQHRIPILICTTGFRPHQLKRLQSILHNTRWQRSANTSEGVRLFHRLVEILGRELSPTHSIQLVETHHVMKKDRPSGTAKALVESYKAQKCKDAPAIEVRSVRKGKIFGIHELSIDGPGETLKITHRAKNRDLFAHGAIELALELIK